MIIKLSLCDVNNVVGGSDSPMCRKTVYSTVATIFTGAGTMLQTFGQTLHIGVADLQPLKAPAVEVGQVAVQENPFQINQRRWGIGISVTGLILNVVSMALSTLSSAERECVNTP